MFLRIFSLLVFAALPGCGSQGGNGSAEVDIAALKETAPPGSVVEQIECATGGARTFANRCAIERSPDGRALTVRHPDGGFRRLDVSADLAVSTADGATPLAGKALPDGRLEITVDGDRYRLPSK